jgi:hypothetical protein
VRSVGNPEALGRLQDYLLIRLITVFDPAFCRVFFFLPFLGSGFGRVLLLQANEEGVDSMARMIAKEK